MFSWNCKCINVFVSVTVFEWVWKFNSSSNNNISSSNYGKVCSLKRNYFYNTNEIKIIKKNYNEGIRKSQRGT